MYWYRKPSRAGRVQPGRRASGSFESLTRSGGKSQRDRKTRWKLMRAFYSLIQRAASLNTMQVVFIWNSVLSEDKSVWLLFGVQGLMTSSSSLGRNFRQMGQGPDCHFFIPPNFHTQRRVFVQGLTWNSPISWRHDYNNKLDILLQVKSMAQVQAAFARPVLGRTVCSAQVQRQLPSLRSTRGGQCMTPRLQRICHSNAALPLRARFTTSAAATAEPAADAPAEEHQYQAEVSISDKCRCKHGISVAEFGSRALAQILPWEQDIIWLLAVMRVTGSRNRKNELRSQEERLSSSSQFRFCHIQYTRQAEQ